MDRTGMKGSFGQLDSALYPGFMVHSTYHVLGSPFDPQPTQTCYTPAKFDRQYQPLCAITCPTYARFESVTPPGYPHVAAQPTMNDALSNSDCDTARQVPSKKEGKRTQAINEAFAKLRCCIPKVPADTKLPKIRTLHLAITYIKHLNDVLAEGSEEHSFVPDIIGRRKRKMVSNGVGVGVGSEVAKKRERTSWPETVWQKEIIAKRS